MNKKNDTKIIVNIPEILHKQIRLSAAEKNITIKNWIMIAALNQLEKEKDKDLHD